MCKPSHFLTVHSTSYITYVIPKGDHGGETLDEVSTALFFFSPGRPLHHSPTSMPRHSIQQIDIVPTLALLLGLPIPFSSLGIPIEVLFSNSSSTSSDDFLFSSSTRSHSPSYIATLAAAKQLARYLGEAELTGLIPDNPQVNHVWMYLNPDRLLPAETKDSTSKSIPYASSHPETLLSENDLREFLILTRQALRNRWATYNIPSMTLGIVIALVSLLSVVYLHMDNCKVYTKAKLSLRCLWDYLRLLKITKPSVGRSASFGSSTPASSVIFAPLGAIGMDGPFSLLFLVLITFLGATAFSDNLVIANDKIAWLSFTIPMVLYLTPVSFTSIRHRHSLQGHHPTPSFLYLFSRRISPFALSLSFLAPWLLHNVRDDAPLAWDWNILSIHLGHTLLSFSFSCISVVVFAIPYLQAVYGEGKKNDNSGRVSWTHSNPWRPLVFCGRFIILLLIVVYWFNETTNGKRNRIE